MQADTLVVKDSQLYPDAVMFVNDIAHVELSAQEFIYPITTPDGNWKLYFHMKPYLSHKVKNFYDQFQTRRIRRTQVESVLEVGDMEEVRVFIDEHFIRF